MRDANIQVMRPLCLYRVRDRDCGRIGGAGKEVDTPLCYEFLRRRGEIARVSGMDRARFGKLPQRIDARADLVFIGERRYMVESSAIIDRQTRVEPPLVLQIETREIAALARVIDDDRGIAGKLVSRVIDGEDADVIVAPGKLLRVGKPESRDVGVRELVGGIRLDAGRG